MAQEWYVDINGEERGPISTDDLKQLARAGDIDEESFVRFGSDGRWMNAGNVSNLFPKKADDQRSWYVELMGEESGPHSLAAMRRMIHQGMVKPDTTVRLESTEIQSIAGEFSELFSSSQLSKIASKTVRPQRIVVPVKSTPEENGCASAACVLIQLAGGLIMLAALAFPFTSGLPSELSVVIAFSAGITGLVLVAIGGGVAALIRMANRK